MSMNFKTLMIDTIEDKTDTYINSAKILNRMFLFQSGFSLITVFLSKEHVFYEHYYLIRTLSDSKTNII